MNVGLQVTIRFLCFSGIIILTMPSDICLCRDSQNDKQFETVVISHPSVKIKALSVKDVQDLFLEKSTKVKTDDNRIYKVTIATLKEGHVHDVFLSEYIKKTISQYKMYWRKKVFSGSGRLPRSFETEAEMIKYISQNNNAIGYISKKTASDPSIIKEAETGRDKVVIIPLSIDRKAASDDK